MKTKIIPIRPFELVLSVVFSLIYLLIIILMVGDSIEFYQNQELYSKVHHLDMSKEYWEWKYLKTAVLYIVLSGFALFGIYKRIKLKSSNWRKINLILMIIFITTVAFGYFQWYKTGFDH